MSIEAIIQSQRFEKVKDQLVQRMKVEDSLEFDNNKSMAQYPKLGINVDPTVNSVLFPPKGPV